MKKIIAMILCVACIGMVLTGCDMGNSSSSSGGGSYTPPIKTYGTMKCTDASIECDMVSWYITPNGFDMEELATRGYYMTISVTYKVKYTRAWNFIGYLGAPKYEVLLLDSAAMGNSQLNITAPSSYTTKSISYTSSAANLKNARVTLTFSSDNIQNKIYFKDIVVTYTCFK